MTLYVLWEHHEGSNYGDSCDSPSYNELVAIFTTLEKARDTKAVLEDKWRMSRYFIRAVSADTLDWEHND